MVIKVDAGIGNVLTLDDELIVATEKTSSSTMHTMGTRQRRESDEHGAIESYGVGAEKVLRGYYGV